jgi:hypothetical protein
MVLRRHEDGALEIVSQGTETQLISRDLLVDLVASLNQNLADLAAERAEVERLRAEVERLTEQNHELSTRYVELLDEIDRKRDYACRMDALAEERLIGWNKERDLVDQLHHAMCVSAVRLSYPEVFDALAAYREGRRER